MASTGGLLGGSALDDELKQSNVVRLRGLPFRATESDISDFFDGLQMGSDGVVICVNFQGKSSGQAYVQFATTEEANKALERNRQHIGNRYIEVFKGHPADMQGALRMVGRGNGALTGSGGLFSTGIPGMGGNPDMRYTGVIRMRGMPYSCTSADILAFFKGMQVAADGVFLCMHADGRPTGEAFVEFINEETACWAMQLDREPMRSRYVELFRSTKGEMMTAVRQRMYGSFSNFAGFSPLGTVSQLPGMMEAFGIQGLAGLDLAAFQPTTVGGISAVQGSKDVSESIIKLRGLPFNAGQREILEFFEGYEIVPNGVYILMGGKDRPTGEAFVEFVSSSEAQRAMKRHRQNMGSRYIELFRATKSEMLLATASSSAFGLALEPTIQLILLQQQAAAGVFGLADLMRSQGASAWAGIQHAATCAANVSQKQVPGVRWSNSRIPFDSSSVKAEDMDPKEHLRHGPTA